jgi:hypothetical protein
MFVLRWTIDGLSPGLLLLREYMGQMTHKAPAYCIEESSNPAMMLTQVLRCSEPEAVLGDLRYPLP